MVSPQFYPSLESLPSESESETESLPFESESESESIKFGLETGLESESELGGDVEIGISKNLYGRFTAFFKKKRKKRKKLIG